MSDDKKEQAALIAEEMPQGDPEMAKTPPTEEEMVEKRKAMIAKMEADLPDLKIEAEYGELVTSIEGNRLARMQIQQQTIQLMMAGQQPGAAPKTEA